MGGHGDDGGRSSSFFETPQDADNSSIPVMRVSPPPSLPPCWSSKPLPMAAAAIALRDGWGADDGGVCDDDGDDQGDVIIMATDGLYDNVELDEILR